MEALFLFSIMATSAGALIGWFHRRRKFGSLWLKTLVATLGLFAMTALILDGPPASNSPRYLFNGLLYHIYPCLLFVFLPALAAATVAWRIHRRVAPKNFRNTGLTIADTPVYSAAWSSRDRSQLMILPVGGFFILLGAVLPEAAWFFYLLGASLILAWILNWRANGVWCVRIDDTVIAWSAPRWEQHRPRAGEVQISSVKRIWLEEGGIFAQMVLETDEGIINVPGTCLGSLRELRQWLTVHFPERLQPGDYPEIS